jgi:branched-chain amino acid transport system permease protein
MLEAVLYQTLSGITAGAIYASLALALVITYRATHLLNFAQGEMATLSTYFAWSLINAGLPYWAAFLLSVAVSFVAGVLIERILIRPVEQAAPLVVITVSVGLFVIFNSVSGWIYTYNTKVFPSPFPSEPLFKQQFISTHELGVVGVIGAMMMLVYGFFRFTRLGLAMRAAAENPVSSSLVGISVPMMLALGWGLASAIGTIGGMMIAPTVYLDPNMMFGVLIYALAAATLGGLDNPAGAVAGGFIVGIVENLAGAFLVGNDLKLTVALALIITVLVFRPAGLFGQRVVKRV